MKGPFTAKDYDGRAIVSGPGRSFEIILGQKLGVPPTKEESLELAVKIADALNQAAESGK